MKKSQFTEEQILLALEQGDAGQYAGVFIVRSHRGDIRDCGRDFLPDQPALPGVADGSFTSTLSAYGAHRIFPLGLQGQQVSLSSKGPSVDGSLDPPRAMQD